jgi:hypothetical protein
LKKKQRGFFFFCGGAICKTSKGAVPFNHAPLPSCQVRALACCAHDLVVVVVVVVVVVAAVVYGGMCSCRLQML